MITENLFDPVLIEPVRDGANRLLIISGYATAAMAFHHLDIVRRMDADIQIELIVGMCPSDGLSVSNHRGFRELVEEEFPGNFQCSYIINSAPVHSKIYSWCRGENPIQAFIGSANYTQSAFRSARREAVANCDENDAFNYFHKLVADTIYCTHHEAENFVRVYQDEERSRKARNAAEMTEAGDEIPQDLVGLPSVSISFLERSGNLPQRSGLNWGQRPEYNREPNQAYIRLPAVIYRTDFFPERTVHFTVLTDDGKVMICARAQDNGKAIHTPHNNSLIGEYFRNRIGVASGEPIRTIDIQSYGRTDVTFYKIDDETYHMDFSV